ncbi:glucokinase [Propionigenium maris DSM 9537]|uniref:Glucokinase n=1 Tax=Propionigenium maris DSM 9537 TaxID=1123000 RepID=A0A9W6GLE0_9FUSO|nr:ROK family protein [Propionigenium maris]GLI56518.1 glucokinase [Propionigenium maris DSM 9537]
MKYVAGVDLGGTNTKIGIVDTEGHIVESTSIKTDSMRGIEDTFTRIWRSIEDLAKKNSVRVEGIGMGIPGPVVDQSVVTFFANFPWEAGTDCSQLMERISGIPTKLDNDVNVIALGEARFGAGRGYRSSVTIALGTGVGGGIYVDGKLISGMTGAGGEIGHMKLVKDGKLCGCGQRGCFEAYTSATGIIREATSRLLVNKTNALYERIGGDLSVLEAKDIFDAAREGDEFSLDIVEYEAEYLAMGIGNILNIINPKAIILGGGVALAGDILLKPLREKLKKYAMGATLDGLEILQAELGNEGGVVGASALVL